MDFILIALLVVGILVLVGAIAAAFVLKKRKEANPEDVDYKAFYILGICFLPIGIVMSIVIGNPGMLGMTGLGVVYIIIGLQNKGKWKKA